jgi:hypothetical protein
VPDLRASDLRAFIPAKDFALSKRFYAALGWETDDVGPGIALVRLGDARHFHIQDYYLKDVAANSMLHVTVSQSAGRIPPQVGSCTRLSDETTASRPPCMRD